MKILYLTTHSEPGGSQRYIYDLSTHFLYKHDVLVSFGDPGDESWLFEKLPKKEIGVFFIPSLKQGFSVIKDIKAVFEIRSLIKNYRPDIVHLNTTKISALGSIACQLFLKKPKVVYTAHGWSFNEKLSSRKAFLLKALEKYTSFLKDKIICVSEHDKNSAIKIGIKKEKIKIIHNGIKQISYKSREQSRKKISDIINDEKFSLDSFIIGTVGKLNKNKGYGYLLNSIKRLVRDGYDLKLVIIGDGEEREKLERIIKEEKLDNNVFLAGYLENASQILRAFDLYINSSIKEGLSYTILEALQIGLPIVVTDIGGNIEIIEDGINGVIAKSRNPEDIANKISYLIDNKSKAELFAMNNKEKIQYFSLEKMFEKQKTFTFP